MRSARTDTRGADAGGPSVESAMRVTLIIGVAITMVFIVAGLVLLAVRGDASFAVGTVAEVARFPNSALRLNLATVARGVRHGRASSLIEVGLLVLVLTPLVREAVAGVVYARRREWLFVAFAVVVVVVLAWTWRGF
jgi:uncharacterized membrane protein